MRDIHDRLIHVLLEEELGREDPPDLTVAILARVRRMRRARVSRMATVAAVSTRALERISNPFGRDPAVGR